MLEPAIGGWPHDFPFGQAFAVVAKDPVDRAADHALAAGDGPLRSPPS